MDPLDPPHLKAGPQIFLSRVFSRFWVVFGYGVSPKVKHLKTGGGGMS